MEHRYGMASNHIAHQLACAESCARRGESQTTVGRKWHCTHMGSSQAGLRRGATMLLVWEMQSNLKFHSLASPIELFETNVIKYQRSAA